MSSNKRKIICSAPGRAGIIGNPSDMYGGAVISCSVGLRAWVTVTPDEGIVVATNGEECYIRSRDDLRPQGDLFDIPRAILSHMREHMRLPSLQCRIQYASGIPLCSGMSGSTALVVATLQALLAWQGEYPARYQLAERARYVELSYLKVVCGYQDAYMCTFGGLNYMDFRGKQFYRSAEAELFATVEPLAGYVAELPFVLGFTGVEHASGTVHKPIRERWLEGDSDAVKGYERMTELACMGKKMLLLRDWPALGRLMNENHAIQRDLGGSGESNERLIDAALDAGALGAKLAGAGHGGTIIALWPWEDITPLEEALRAAGAMATYRLEIAPGAMIERDE
jgi:galactokinase/mevalonate kinase-like predicted kinase